LKEKYKKTKTKDSDSENNIKEGKMKEEYKNINYKSFELWDNIDMSHYNNLIKEIELIKLNILRNDLKSDADKDEKMIIKKS